MGQEDPPEPYRKEGQEAMTQLMTDPIDHWLDLDVQIPRRPIREEMYEAFERAASSPTGDQQVIWTGVATGYAIAFGLFTRAALDNARRIPGVQCVHPQDYSRGRFHDEETVWASGLLYGYAQGTSELDVTTCAQCAQRLVHDVDDMERCHHGDFCPDHIGDWHKGDFPTGDGCTYMDAGWQ